MIHLSLLLLRVLTVLEPRRDRTGRCRHAGPGAVPLAHGEVRRVVVHAGQALQCLQGCVWVTAEGDPVDHVLDAGDEYRPAGAVDVVLYALEDARWCMREPARGHAAMACAGA